MKSFFLFILLQNIFFPASEKANDTTLTSKDSTHVESNEVQQEESLNSAELKLKSAESVSEIKKLSSEIINDEKIKELSAENRSFVRLIREELRAENDSSFNDKSPRYLNNRLNNWNRNLDKILKQNERLSKHYQDLESSLNKLDKELSVWQTTIIHSNLNDSVAANKSIKELTVLIDQERSIISSKKDIVSALMDKTSLLQIDVQNKIEVIDSFLMNIEQNVFERNQPSFFSLDFTPHKVRPMLSPHIFQDVQELETYLLNKRGLIIFHFLITAIIIFFFRRIRNSHGFDDIPESSFYLNNLHRIVSHSVSAGLLLSLLLSNLLYSDPPIIFFDLLRNITLIPTTILLFKLLPKKLRPHLLGVIFLLIIHQFQSTFPAESTFNRMLILSVAALEFALLLSLLYTISKHKKGINHIKESIKYLVILLLAVSVFAIAGNLIGALVLAQITTGAVIKTLNTTITIGLGATILNGIITLGIRSPRMNELNFIANHGIYLKGLFIKLVNSFSFLTWLYLLFSYLFIEDIIIEKIEDIYNYTWALGAFSIRLGSVLSFIFIIWASTIISRVIRIILKEDILIALPLNKGLPHSIATMVQYGLVVLGIVFAVSVAGFPLDSLTFVVGAISVGIGFGLQNIFNNLVSGLILLFERPIQLEDTIEVGPNLGTVKSLGIRSSNVRTFDGAEIIIPNGELISKEVTNWTLSDQKRRISINVGISYKADPHQAQELFLSLVEDHDMILKNPKPLVLFEEFGDSSLNFKILFWTSSIDKWLALKSEITFKVFDALKEAGIEIPFPQRDIHIKEGSK